MNKIARFFKLSSFIIFHREPFVIFVKHLSVIVKSA